MVSISCILITSARLSLTFLEGERGSGLIDYGGPCCAHFREVPVASSILCQLSTGTNYRTVEDGKISRKYCMNVYQVDGI